MTSLPDLNLVLIMTLNRLFGGQKFIPNSIPKAARMHSKRQTENRGRNGSAAREVKEAHQLSENGRTRGEIVFTGRCIEPAIDSQGNEWARLFKQSARRLGNGNWRNGNWGQGGMGIGGQDANLDNNYSTRGSLQVREWIQ
jgi:hypothetical protein